VKELGEKLYGDRMKKEKIKNSVNLRRIFMGLQEEMITRLSTGRENILHPSAKGEASELNWIKWLEMYLPKRYQTSKAFVLDSSGNMSEQIDLVIYDRQYSPFLFKHEGALYIPAESVYGVFEVKQSLNKNVIEYAGSKAASVRKLYRTSAPIIHAGGEFKPRSPIPILAGILVIDSEWKPSLGPPLQEVLKTLNKLERLDLGCALRNGSFEAIYENRTLHLEKSRDDDVLIFFFLKLLSRLQQVGTVPAMEIAKYANALKNMKNTGWSSRKIGH